MKIRYRINELRRERDRLADYVRCDEPITRPLVIILCNEISEIDAKMDRISKMSFEETEQEHIEWTVEISSSLNNELTPIIQRKKKKLVDVPRTWERF